MSALLACAPRRRAAAAPPAWSPLSESSLELWLDFTDSTRRWQDTSGTIAAVAAGDPVALVQDKSPHARHYTQPTASKRPTVALADGTFAGRDVLDMTATQGLLAPSGLIVTGAQTWVIVCRRTATTATYGYAVTLYGGGLASAIFLGISIFPPTAFAFSYASGGLQIAGESADLARHVTRLTYDGTGQSGSDYVVKRDGVAATLGGTSFGADPNGGAINGDRSGNYGQAMRMSEVLIFSTDSATVMASLDSWLAARYP